jgi:hypothetical protein
MALPAPQSKPVAAASRLVAQVAPLVAFGPRLRILAAGPAPPNDCTPISALERESQQIVAIATTGAEDGCPVVLAINLSTSSPSHRTARSNDAAWVSGPSLHSTTERQPRRTTQPTTSQNQETTATSGSPRDRSAAVSVSRPPGPASAPLRRVVASGEDDRGSCVDERCGGHSGMSGEIVANDVIADLKSSRVRDAFSAAEPLVIYPRFAQQRVRAMPQGALLGGGNRVAPGEFNRRFDLQIKGAGNPSLMSCSSSVVPNRVQTECAHCGRPHGRGPAEAICSNSASACPGSRAGRR